MRCADLRKRWSAWSETGEVIRSLPVPLLDRHKGYSMTDTVTVVEVPMEQLTRLVRLIQSMTAELEEIFAEVQS